MAMIAKQFDDFTIVDKIGEGGMGRVYLAVQNSLDREVAIKAIIVDQSFDSSEKVERFLREARATASIQHPNIVNIYKVGKHENFFYIAMEYVEGSSLDGMLQKGALPEINAWQITLQICCGLQAALQKGIIHRDIKPGNILLLPGNLAKLTDFGLSKKISDEAHLTQAGAILGSPSYMSPEQASGKNATFQSDIYSLGATVYQMLSGQVMFSGDSIVDILYQHKSVNPPSPQELVPTLKPESSMVLAKMIAKSPNDRYQSYGDAIADINALIHGQKLNFCEISDALSVYRKGDKFHKTGKKYILTSLFSGFTDTRKLETIKHPLLFITELSIDFTLPECDKFKIHIVASHTELRACLQRDISMPTLLDGKRLGPAAIDFLNLLKIEFPKTPLIIMLNSIPKKVPERLSGLFYPCGEKCEEQMAKTLTQRIANPNKFYARQLNLQIVLALAKSQEWNTRLWIDEGTGNSGKIILQQGKIIKAQRGELHGKKALDILIKHNRSWQSGKSSSSSMNASLEKMYSAIQEISQNIQKTSSSAYVEEHTRDNRDSETILNSPLDLILPKKSEKLILAEIRHEISAKNDEKSEPTTVKQEISENKSNFNKFMDAALDALLVKDYSTACQNFFKASEIFPDNTRVKTNLNRLKDMGYNMEDDK